MTDTGLNTHLLIPEPVLNPVTTDNLRTLLTTAFISIYNRLSIDQGNRTLMPKPQTALGNTGIQKIIYIGERWKPTSVKIHKGKLYLNGIRKPWGRALIEVLLAATYITSKERKIWIVLTRSACGEFSIQILTRSQRLIHGNINVTFLPVRRRTFFTWEFHLLFLRQERKTAPCPSNNVLTTTCSQYETTKTSNSFISKELSFKTILPSFLKPDERWPYLHLFGLAYDSLQPAFLKLLFSSIPK